MNKENYLFELNGTHFQREINTTYEKIKKIYGLPARDVDSYKVDAEWQINTPHGIGTIYNYKDGKNYLGKEGLNRTEITEWHIGGHNPETAEYITKELLN